MIQSIPVGELAKTVGEHETSNIAEVSEAVVKEIPDKGSAIPPDLEQIQSTTLEAVMQKNVEEHPVSYQGETTLDPEYTNLGHADEVPDYRKGLPNESQMTEVQSLTDELEKKGLTPEEKEKIQEETGWPDEVVDQIGSMEEYEIYKNAGLQAQKIDGKWCLVRGDIDWNQVDEMGRTNRERADQGLSPINKDGKVIELHHIGQHADSPLAELTPEEHRGKGNDAILHDKSKETEIDRTVFAVERSNHWEARAYEGGQQK